MLHLDFQAIVRLQISNYNQTIPSPIAPEFFHWTQQQTNPRYQYIHYLGFLYLLDLFMYLKGVQEGNSSLLLGGRFILGDLFYTTNIRIYMEVDFRDIVLAAF